MAPEETISADLKSWLIYFKHDGMWLSVLGDPSFLLDGGPMMVYSPLDVTVSCVQRTMPFSSAVTKVKH